MDPREYTGPIQVVGIQEVIYDSKEYQELSEPSEEAKSSLPHARKWKDRIMKYLNEDQQKNMDWLVKQYRGPSVRLRRASFNCATGALKQAYRNIKDEVAKRFQKITIGAEAVRTK